MSRNLRLVALLLAVSCFAEAFGEEPPLSDEELGTAQQQALLLALAGDAYAHRAADHRRAGAAMHVRPHAKASNTPQYGGYQVGGGLALWGDPPATSEGTFGWDYFGLFFRKPVDLLWSHGGRHQGGTGSPYERPTRPTLHFGR